MISFLWNSFVRNVFVVVAVVVMFYAPQCSSSDTFHVNSRGNGGGGGHSDEDNDSNHRDYSMLCMDIKPQHSVDIEQIMGMWYGSEIIKHTPDIPGTFHINSCVVIHISDVTQQMQMSTRSYNYNSYSRSTSTGTYQQQAQQQSQQQQQTPQRQQQHNQQNQQQQQQQQSPLWSPKYLRLIWSEKDDHLEYTFNYTEFSPGLWTNVDDQRGSLVALNKYTQFHGTVQVVKAVHDHLVLTFCGSDEKSLIYTIVLSRQEQGLSSEELRSIRNLLSRRGLSTATIHKVCTSGAANLPISELLLMLGVFYVATRQQWK